MKFINDGWYGIISDDFTFKKVRIVAKAIAKYLISHELYKKSVVIGYDTRFLSYQYAQIMAEVFLGNNIKCFIAERDIPEVAVAGAVKSLKCSSGIMITANNMPYQYNGIKFIPDYAGPSFSHISMEIERNIRLICDMEEEIESKSYAQGVALSLIEPLDIYKEYLKLLEKRLDLKRLKEKDLKIVVDCMNGTIRGNLNRVSLKNIEWIEVNSEYNPTFAGRRADPEYDNLDFLCETVKNVEADLGVAFDVSGGKITFIDRNGKKIDRNILIGIILEYIIQNKNKNGEVIKSSSTTRLIDTICSSNGIEIIETFSGFKNIAEKIMKNKVIFACEDSGGISYSAHIPYKDSILMLFTLLEIMCSVEMDINDLIKDFIERHGEVFSNKIIYNVSDDEEKLRVVGRQKNVINYFNSDDIKDVIQTDGIKVVFNDNSWFLIKTDPVEPKFEIFIESSDKKMITSIENNIKKFFGV